MQAEETFLPMVHGSTVNAAERVPVALPEVNRAGTKEIARAASYAEAYLGVIDPSQCA